MSEINIGIVGTQFMGRAHSNAYLDVAHYFNLTEQPIMMAACDSVSENLPPFMKKFGWQTSEVPQTALSRSSHWSRSSVIAGVARTG